MTSKKYFCPWCGSEMRFDDVYVDGKRTEDVNVTCINGCCLSNRKAINHEVARRDMEDNAFTEELKGYKSRETWLVKACASGVLEGMTPDLIKEMAYEIFPGGNLSND